MPADRLNVLLEAAGEPPLPPALLEKFDTYLALLQRWNAHTNLTAIRDEEGILARHFLESILCARHLPAGLATLLDFGSGAGFPGLPIALIYADTQIILAESQHKKAAFLREATRALGVKVRVHSGRAETLAELFDCVTLRAVDSMDRAIPAALALIAPGGWLAVMTSEAETAHIQKFAKSVRLTWSDPLPLPAGTKRLLLLAQKPRV